MLDLVADMNKFVLFIFFGHLVVFREKLIHMCSKIVFLKIRLWLNIYIFFFKIFMLCNIFSVQWKTVEY